jgi:hypothetical protein
MAGFQAPSDTFMGQQKQDLRKMRTEKDLLGHPSQAIRIEEGARFRKNNSREHIILPQKLAVV